MILMGKSNLGLIYEISNFIKNYDFETFIKITIDTLLHNFKEACIVAMMPHVSS